MKWILLGLIGVVALTIVVVAVAGRRWERNTHALVEELRGGYRPASEPRSLDSLPEPVARYFDDVFEGEPRDTRYVRLTQVGEFRMSADENSWRPFRATQHVDLTAPGFVWDARIEMAPLVTVRVRDAYVGGRGTMLGTILSVVTVVNERARDELSSGSLLRYLAESAWFPTALLPREALRWRAVDDDTAEATLTDAGIEVRATFHFDDDGNIVGVSADRYREVEGDYVRTPWRGRFWNHAVRGTTRIPLEGEVSWVLPEGEFPYWRGRILDVRPF